MKIRPSAPLDLEPLSAIRPILDALPFPVLWIDGDYVVRFRNAAAQRTYGAAPGSCHELTHGFSRPCDEHGELCPMADVTREQAPVSVCHAHVTGERSVSLHQVIAVPVKGGGILESQIGLDDLVSEDGLTRVFGRGFFVRIVERELALLERLGEPYAFLLVDVDEFKGINDAHGHDVGDEVLREIADALRTNLRKSDAAGRWGGDELALFLPSLARADAVALSERRLAAIRRLSIPSPTGRVEPRVSGGLYWSEHVYDLKSAFHAADRALYAAKRAGGDRVVTAPVDARPRRAS
ncbi:MAG: diguanylate cyclase [Acidobacteriota bacterium]|nr:diguanylate cyclase [Acidobacteriota bacterium]MDH3525473.1 diguanylate cyclase [Acidobacteriota bacterium]